MNLITARESLDLAAEKAVSFALRNNFRHAGPFVLYAHEVDEATVKVSQAAERKANPGLPLVASRGMKPGTHAVLMQIDKDLKDRTVWMSTHEAEKETQAEFVAAAKGRVLIAGFGLGLVTDAVLAKPNVTEVVVVELNGEVIRLMNPFINGLRRKGQTRRLRIVCRSIFDYKPSVPFDAIYFDIWPTISAMNLTDMIKLRRQFAPHLSPGGWIGCWAEREYRDSLDRVKNKVGGSAMKTLKLLDELFAKNTKVTICNVDENRI